MSSCWRIRKTLSFWYIRFVCLPAGVKSFGRRDKHEQFIKAVLLYSWRACLLAEDCDRKQRARMVDSGGTYGLECHRLSNVLKLFNGLQIWWHSLMIQMGSILYQEIPSLALWNINTTSVAVFRKSSIILLYGQLQLAASAMQPLYSPLEPILATAITF